MHRLTTAIIASGLFVAFMTGLLVAFLILMTRLSRASRRRLLLQRAERRRMLNADPGGEVVEALVREAQDGLSAGASVQILISGYPIWLAITALWSQGEHLLHVTLEEDESGILIGKSSIIGARFGQVHDSE